MISKKIYLYSMTYICIQSKFNEKYLYSILLFLCSIKNHTRTLFQIAGYQKSYSGYFLSFTNVQLTL